VAAASGPARPAARGRLKLGHLAIDPLTLAGAVDAVEALVDQGRGGVVVTPNVDHVVIAERDEGFRAAYAAADLVLADGMPIVWASRILGVPLPEKVSGSDLVLPLMTRAAARGWRVFLLGAGPGVAEEAAGRLRRALRVEIVGTAAPAVNAAPGAPDRRAITPWRRSARRGRSSCWWPSARPSRSSGCTPAARSWRRPCCSAWAPASTSSPAACGVPRAGCRVLAWSGCGASRASRGGSGAATSWRTRASSRCCGGP
jgi:hypothetical protein